MGVIYNTSGLPTPTPWRWNDKDQLVSTVKVLDSLDDEMIEPVIIETDSGFYPPSAQDREFIERACNSHDELVAVSIIVRDAIFNCVDNFPSEIFERLTHAINMAEKS